MADIQVANTDADLSGNTVVTEENAYTITGLHTFSRSTNAPFACISGAAYVQYLDSDKLDGQEGTYYLAAANFTGTLAVNQGGTGAATFTDGGILLGSGTGAITATAVLGDGVILIGDASGDPTTLDVGSSTAITILGTVATGVWNGTAVTVPYGGTGATSLTDGGVLLGSGTGAITATAVLGDGVILIGDASGDPTTLDVGSSTAITILGTVATGVWNGTAVTVAYGGTGASSLTDGGVLLGSGTGAVTAMAVLADSEMIVGDGSGDPVAESGATLRTSVGVGTGDSPQFTGLTLTGDLVVDTDTLFVDASEDKVAIGTTAMDGLLHIQSASAGSVSAHANADELVVEGSGNSGITILAGATSTANVFFGDAGNSSEGAIYFTNNATTASLNIQNEFGYINLLPSGGAATGVGVGVNDPDVMLDVSGGDNVLDIFRITQRASGAAAYGLQVGLAATGDPVFQRLVNDVATESFRIVRATGDVTMAEDLSVTGALSKGSGSFKIDHPLPAKTDTHHLIHSFIEGPRCDLIYRGTVTLVDGTAQVDLDDAAGMTSGTWVLLCRDEQCFTSNETGWQHVRGTVSGSTLTIDCEEAICTDTVSWMVVASRKDQHIMETDWTDEDGYPIIEPLKPDPEPDPE